MKIYRFPNQTGPEGYRKNTFHSSRQEKEYLKPVAGGEDMVIISPEAMERFNKHNLIKMDRFLVKKEADSVKEIVFEKIRMDTLTRELTADETISRIRSQPFIFADESIAESAELVSILYNLQFL